MEPDRICIKVPFSEIGLRVLHALATRGVHTNVTCMMSFNQAYLAALAGATYISIFAGASATWATTSAPIIQETRDMLDRERLESKIIVGSMRHMMDVNEALAVRRAHRHRAARDPAQDAAEPAHRRDHPRVQHRVGQPREVGLASEIDVEVFDRRLERVLLVQK